MSEPRSWSTDYGFIAAVGVRSADEFARALLNSNDSDGSLEDLGFEPAQHPHVDDVEAALIKAGINVHAVPIPMLRMEEWDSSRIYKIEPGEKLRPGYALVWNVNV